MVSPFAKQAWTASGVLLVMVAQGMMLSYTSCLLPALRAPNSTIKVDVTTESWLSSSIGISAAFGFVTSGIVMEYWGRRITHILGILPGMLGWIIIYLASDITSIVIGRLFSGFASGFVVMVGSISLGEYTSPKHRGMFLNLKTVCVYFGGTLVHILDRYVFWTTIALLALVPYIASLIIIFTWPESPAWLASKKKFEESQKSFYWLRGENEKAVREYEDLIRAQIEQSSRFNRQRGDKLSSFFKKITRKDFLMPMAIIALGSVLIESSGRHTFQAFASDIIGKIVANKSHTFYYTLGLDFILTVSSFCSSALAKICRRRTALFGTGLAALVVLSAVSVNLYWSSGTKATASPWIPLSMLVIFFILVNLGCIPISYAFLGEVIPLAHKGIGSVVSGCIMSFTLYTSLHITPILLQNIEVYGTFATAGVCMSIALLILYFIVPETKDKTLQEIENYFNNASCKRTSEDIEITAKMLKGNDKCDHT